MRLTGLQEDMLAGKLGEACRIAMQVLVRVGEAYEAEDMIDIRQAHIDGCSLSAAGIAGLEFAELLSGHKARVTVPTSLNITARDIERWREFRIPKEHSDLSARMEAAYLDMGCVPTWTCSPYHYGIVPRRGEAVAWAESNAIAYVNSVIGAHTARLGDFMDISAAIVGSAPRMGLYLPEQRWAGVEIRLRDLGDVPGDRDELSAVIGYLVGHLSDGKVPAITGLWPDISADELKSLSAAAASSGDIGLFHVVGVTPEAPTLETAGGGRAPVMVVEVGGSEIEEFRRRLDQSTARDASLIAVGCPHLSYPELERTARLLAGRQVAPGIEFWLMTNQTVRRWGEVTGAVSELERLGARVMTDTCVLNWPLDNWGFSSLMTNSGKLAHYCFAQTGLLAGFGSLRGCVEAAVSGRRWER